MIITTMKNYVDVDTITITKMHAAADTITITRMHAAADTIAIMREHKEADRTFEHAEKQVYILENLGCAHCASKMEEKDSGTAAGRVCCNYLRDKTTAGCDKYGCGAVRRSFRKICASIESEVVVRKRDGGSTGKRESAKGRFSENKKDLWEIGIGAVLFVLGLATQEMNGWISFFALIIGYLILGKDVLITAAKNIGKGHVFDENFLMGVATIAAIVIGDYKEAVGVMLFYRVGELFEDIAVARSREVRSWRQLICVLRL